MTMKRDDFLLATIFSPDPIRQRQIHRRLLRGAVVALALEFAVALAATWVILQLIDGLARRWA